MKWILITLGCCYLSLYCNNVNAQHKANKKPNIIIVLVDDLGVSDLGYAQKKFITPHIDALKENSAFFPNARVTTPTCSPSRAILLTGKSALDHRVIRHIPSTSAKDGFDKNGETNKEFNYLSTDPANVPSKNWLDLSQITYAEELKKSGYYNAFIGKWHLGHSPYYPVHQGFDEQYFITNAGNPAHYYPPYFNDAEDAKLDQTYLTDSITTLACNFIKQHNNKQPFQLSLYYYNVHGPHQGRTDLVKMYLEKGLSKIDAEYAAMVSSVDESIGKIVDELKQSKQWDNTVLFFIGDQGGYFNNVPYRGSKMKETLYEGGSRVPFFIHAPALLKAQIIQTAVSTADVFPTIMQLAGNKNVKPNKFKESLSLIPLIEKGKQSDRILYSFRAYESLYASLLEDNLKFLAFRDGKTELYDLKNDISEQKDISKEHPQKVKYFIKKLKKWEMAKNVRQYSPFFAK